MGGGRLEVVLNFFDTKEDTKIVSYLQFSCGIQLFFTNVNASNGTEMYTYKRLNSKFYLMYIITKTIPTLKSCSKIN